MLTSRNKTSDNGQARSDDAQKFSVAHWICLEAMSRGPKTVGGQAHPRRHRGRRNDNSCSGCCDSDEVKPLVNLTRQLRHVTKLGGEASQYLRAMKEITPYCPEIRFSDVDAYGIVHNAKYIVYMEQARIHWWRQAMGDAPDGAAHNIAGTRDYFRVEDTNGHRFWLYRDGLYGRETLAPALDFMDRCVEEEAPFFLWYAPFLPHRPHDPPERLEDGGALADADDARLRTRPG